jgi:ribosomal protein S18 acetylase RimI-like enzyme
MLRLSREEDMPLVRDLIVDGAKAGSFDLALAQPTNEAAYFFSGVRRVILEHVWLRPAPGSETQIAIPAAIWVYEETQVSPRALGFFALRGAGHLGYELWLVAIHPEYRNRGLGKQMISEILATPVGRQIVVAQCDLHAIGARRLAWILCEAGFQSARRGKACEWLANPGLSPSALAWLKATPFQTASGMN